MCVCFFLNLHLIADYYACKLPVILANEVANYVNLVHSSLEGYPSTLSSLAELGVWLRIRAINLSVCMCMI
jgi:hypothetical protein